MMKKLVLVATALLAILVIGGAGVVLNFLDQWGVSWGMASSINHHLNADAAAVRDAEGSIRTPNGISERGFVRIGGIDQWVTIRGQDRRNPAILVLHGGPGDAYSQLAYLLRPWEKDFTIIQWDQRGAGRTFGRYGEATPNLTLDRMVEDGAEVADYARRRLAQQKIILLGHSWGSALGLYILKRHPALFSAYVGTGQLVNTAALDRNRYAFTLARLKKDGRTKAAADLLRLGPPPYPVEGRDEIVRRQLNRYLAPADKAYLFTSVAVELRDPQYSLKAFSNLMKGHLDFSLPRLHRTYEEFDAGALGYDMPVPFFIIDGRDDQLSPPSLVEPYFQKIRAPEKAMVLIDGGHFAFMSNARGFLALLLKDVRPVAMAPQ